MGNFTKVNYVTHPNAPLSNIVFTPIMSHLKFLDPQHHAAKFSRHDGPGTVESSVGPTLLCLYRPDGACRFSSRQLLRILGNSMLQLPFQL